MKPIKDSGTRREFETGAVRDMQEGKGRCDLLPACAILRKARHFEAGAKKYGDRNWEQGIPLNSFIDSALRHIFKYLDGQTDEDHLCAASWNLDAAMWTEEKRPDLINIPTRPEYREAKVVEEQGRLVELPCKVGTKLYWINDSFNSALNPMWGQIEEVEVCEFTYNGHSLQIWFADNGLKEYLPLPSVAIGKELFYTKEEAEAKMKEIGGENDA